MQVDYFKSGDGFCPASEPVFCCQAMRQEWGALIGFGPKGASTCSRPGVYLYTTHHLYGGTESIYGITPIRYCPFCGEMIDSRAGPVER
jgi:hypothetical protein